MNWQTNDTAPTDGRKIIIAGRGDQSQSYDFNVVFYYEPMGLWYGGPGIMVRKEDIEYWSDIQAPDEQAP